MSNIPENLYYTESHEWVRLESDGTITMGITDHAQAAMGDIVYVEVPKVGKTLTAKGDCGVLESVKTAADYYAPVAGEVFAVNEELATAPALVNTDPYGKGWLAKIRPANVEDVKKLMNAADYKKIGD
jgi:glycine cleavage system H protein